jgi:hypothetical protein
MHMLSSDELTIQEASYNPFESLHIDSIGPPPSHPGYDRCIHDVGRIIPTKISGATETAVCISQHFGRFGTPNVIHTYQGQAFCGELFSKLSRLSKVKHSFVTAYSKEENGLSERANQELMCHAFWRTRAR